MCGELPTGDEIQIAAVQFALKGGNPHRQHVLMFGRQTLAQLGVISPLQRQISAQAWHKSDTLQKNTAAFILTCTQRDSMAWRT